MPQYRKDNGTARLDYFLIKQVKYMTGLYPYVLQWCKDNEVEVVDGTKITETKVDDNKVDKFIEALKIPFKVRDYQKEHLYMRQDKIDVYYCRQLPLVNL